MTRKKRFIMAGGGTGGHIFPAIAIANAIMEAFPDAEFLFVGAKGKMEMEKVPEAGYKIEGLTIAGFDRSSLIKNIWLPFKLIRSFFQVAGIFKRFRPDAVIGVGGYSSFPVLRYAQAKGLPTFIHESNSFAGKSNILLGKKATAIFTSCEAMEKFFPAEKIIISGNPVRKNIAAPVSRKEALSFFGLSEDRKTILIVGGSLGARSINEAIDGDLDQLDQAGVQVIWQTGKPYHEKARLKGTSFNWVRVYDFLNRMDLAYKAADVVISRSGAMAVSELCIAGKPVIFVPFPHAAEDHQKSNARRLVEKEAALMITDEDVKSLLMPKLSELLNDESLQQKLKENILKLAVWDADKVVAANILKALN